MTYDFEFDFSDPPPLPSSWPVDLDFQYETELDFDNVGIRSEDATVMSAPAQRFPVGHAEPLQVESIQFDIEGFLSWAAEQESHLPELMPMSQPAGTPDQFWDPVLFPDSSPDGSVDMTAAFPPLPGPPPPQAPQPLDLFPCLVSGCLEVLADSEALRIHNEISHGRRHHCLVAHCHRSFQYSKDLDRHALTHSKVKRWNCPVTDCIYHRKGFAREDTFWKHMKRAHGVVKPDGGGTRAHRKSDPVSSSGSSNLSP